MFVRREKERKASKNQEKNSIFWKLANCIADGCLASETGYHSN